MAQAPVLVGLHFCQGFELDPNTREVSLRGLFRQIQVEAFPSEPVRLSVFAPVTDGRGEGRIKLEFFEVHDQGTPRWIYSQEKWVRFVDPTMILNLEFRPKKLQFRIPGEHLVQLSFEGEYVSSRPLTVALTEHQ